jgi:heat shock protein HspQ
MVEVSQLPFLIQLIDDEDPATQAQVLDALASFGPDLDAALAQLDDPPDPHAIERLKVMLEAHVEALAAESVTSRMRFEPGQVVRHRRYGYRGVVVDADPTCQADEAWYQATRSQPDRDQPWYHVLVHNSMQVTYAAQSNLDTDDSGLEVDHPYVAHFFSEFRDGQYVRNDQPWPG